MTPLLLAAFLMAADGPPPVNLQIDYQGFQRLESDDISSIHIPR